MAMLKSSEIKSMAGDISDHTIVELMELEAEIDDLEQALAFEEGARLNSAGKRSVLTGKAEDIHRILFHERGVLEEEAC